MCNVPPLPPIMRVWSELNGEAHWTIECHKVLKMVHICDKYMQYNDLQLTVNPILHCLQQSPGIHGIELLHFARNAVRRTPCNGFDRRF
ncbi:hypothetical protein Y032_0034g2795 [Ancylostoma ceylanicum]|uniref:Uncharacterized protein n=1 Tax=Ancylostoma ceylanicum TaxID=53326 RepID=A0A016UMN3_9BILA|nr:hypothetical protein Y032_0034g2795 [Ancylostoma ceylanicum]